MKTCIEWGIVSKYPGDEKDYRLLARSQKQETDHNYHALIRDWLVGELPFESSSKGSGAPWYIFGLVDNPLRQIVIEQKWTDYSDRHGRPVQIMTCLLIPFDDLAQSACGFQQMAELFSSDQVVSFLEDIFEQVQNKITLEDQPCIEIELPTREESLHKMLRDVHEIGLDRCMELANILATKPMGIIWGDTNVPLWQTRLKWLDAIMTLLPYGMRANCPASSWASSGIDHKMRLYWAGRALQTHFPVWLDAEKDVVSSMPDCEFIRQEKMVLAHTELQNLITQLASLGEPLTFNEPIPEFLLDEFGKVFMVFEELRVAEALSPDLLASALTCLKNQRVKALSVGDQAIFMKKLLPSLQLSDVLILKPYWADFQNEQILRDVIAGLEGSSLTAEVVSRFRVVAQIFTQSKNLDGFLDRIREGIEEGKFSRDIIFQLLVHIPQDAINISNEVEMEESEGGFISDLSHFIMDFSISEEEILRWVSLLAKFPGRLQETVFKNYLKRIFIQGDFEGDSFLRLLRNIWLETDGLQSYAGKELDFLANRHLIALIQSAIINNFSEIYFRKALRRLREDQLYHPGELPENFYELLQIPFESMAIFSAEEIVLIDEMRLTAGQQSLALVNILQDEHDYRLKDYIQELSYSFHRFTPYERDEFCGKVRRSLLSLLPEFERTDAFLNNLSLLYKEFASLCEVPNDFHDLLITLVCLDIEKVIDANATIDEMVEICKPMLVWEYEEPNQATEESNWDLLIKIFSDKHYPKTADELWSLLRCFVGYGYQKNIDVLKLEKKFHKAVVFDDLLGDLYEKKRYKSKLASQIYNSIENLHFIAASNKDQPYDQFYLQNLEDYAHNLIRGVFRNL